MATGHNSAMVDRFPFVFVAQLAAIVITAAFVMSLNLLDWLLAVYIFAFSHYFIGAWYSRKAIFNLVRTPAGYLPALVLISAGTVAYFQSASLLLYFGLHHALSEAYLRQRLAPSTSDDAGIKRLQASSFWLHLSAFVLLVRHDQLFTFDTLIIPAAAVLVVSTVLFLRQYVVLSNRGLVTNPVNQCGSEVLVLFILVVSLYHSFTLFQVVFYHFALWALLPLLHLGQPGRAGPLASYLIITVVSLALFVGLSPLTGFTDFSFFTFQKWFVALSFVHITLSFAISAANPDWIRNLFRGMPTPARANQV